MGTADQPLVLSHFLNVMKKYAIVIASSVLMVILGVAILTAVVFLHAPVRRVTSLPFRLDFEGATTGRYPNGLKFSVAEITGIPILLTVYRANDLSQFMKFQAFMDSVFVIESSQEYERLALEYQSKLSDPKLTPVDRERIESEFEQKRLSLTKSDYSINFSQPKRISVPTPIVVKVLNDILASWAHEAVEKKRVLQYRVPVLSTNILDPKLFQQHDFIIALIILRSKTEALLDNIASMKDIPGAELVQTPEQLMSLAEVALRLRTVNRFQIEPLILRARDAGYIRNVPELLQVIEAQLAYDRRSLDAARSRQAALQSALAAYEQETTSARAGATSGAQSPSKPSPTTWSSPETLVPQLSESFLDRIINLANRTGDREYRQRMVDDIKVAGLSTVPPAASLAYDTQLADAFRGAHSGTADPAEIRSMQQEAQQAYAALSDSVAQVNAIYRIVSSQLNPVTELYSTLGPAMTLNQRAISITRLGIFAIALVLASIPAIVFGCILHNRVQEEEAIQRQLDTSGETATA